MKKYLLSEADRRELIQALANQRKAPPPRNIARTPVFPSQEGDTYWVIPPCEQGLPAAGMTDGVPHPIGVQACLYRHSWRNTELEPMVGPTGLPLRVTVYNYFDRDENNLTQVYKQKDGTWTNARPDDYDIVTKNKSTADASTTPEPESTPLDARCVNQCKWVADGNGVWQGPTGGCTNGTSSSTTTTTVAPTTTGSGGGGTGGGYSTALPNPPTLAPCIASRCRLECGTVAPGTGTTVTGTGTTTPTPMIYYRATGTAGVTGTGTTGCPAGCSCYGLGDPCYLLGGELLSHCIGPAPTQEPTTTLDPHAPACELAEALFGVPSDVIYRAAVHGGVAETWDTCHNCEDGKVPLFPLGGEEFRYSDRPGLVTVYESICAEAPCSIEVPAKVAGRAVFLAYSYEKQLFRWFGAGQYLDSEPGRFRANWFMCTPCSGRPETSPPYWIYDSAAQNAAQGVRYDEAAGVYVFEVDCKAGIACDTCGRAPYVFPTTAVPPPSTGTSGTGTTTAPTTTASASTTTPIPCSCERPTFCGDPGQCTYTRCSVGGELLPRNPNLACFPDSTTAAPYTTGAGTTLPPSQCIDWRGVLCNCNAQTTRPADGGTCPPGEVLVPGAGPCDPPVCQGTLPPVPPTTQSPPPCNGY